VIVAIDVKLVLRRLETAQIFGDGVYTGRTSGTETPLENIAKRDKHHHMNKKGFGPAELDKSHANSRKYLSELWLILGNL